MNKQNSISRIFYLLVTLLCTLTNSHGLHYPDKGKEAVARIKATLYYGTNNKKSPITGEKISDAMLKRITKVDAMKFAHYSKIGEDTQAVLRSYQNWLSPLKNSKEIMLCFESRGRHAEGLMLDLHLWQKKRKVMKSNPIISAKKPLLILGPKWRDGRLVLAVELLELYNKK